MDADPTENAPLPAPVTEALTVWLSRHDELAPGLIEGLYVVGSAVLDDWRPGSDVDVVAVTADPPTDVDVVVLRRAADATADDLAGSTTVDGPIVAWGDLASPPLSAMRPWTLDGVFHFDGEGAEINPVTWYVLDRHGVAIRGPRTDALGLYVDERDRISWVVENADTYWRGVRGQLATVLADDPSRTTFDADVVEWCALGIARMLLTATTGDVASKTAAGEWTARRMPEHADVLAEATAIRARHDPSEVVTRAVLDATLDLLDASLEILAA